MKERRHGGRQERREEFDGTARNELDRRGEATGSRGGGAGQLSVRRRPEDLTPREREILQLIWGGHTNRSIAQHLSISIKTAEAHRSNMMKKLRVSNTAQLLKVALEGRILEAHDGKH